MNKMRIYEIAKQLDADNNDVVDLLKKKGFDINSSLCSIEVDEKLLKEIKTEIKMTTEEKNETSKQNVEEKKVLAKPNTQKKENTLIKTEELAKKTEESTSKDKKEKLSVFYRKKEETDDIITNTPCTPAKKIHATYNKKSETKSPKTNFFSNTIALIGLIVSITAIVITLNIYSNNLFVPQRVDSLIEAQESKAGDLALIKNELRNLERKFERRLNDTKKADLVVQLSVIKELANNSSGQIKRKLHDIEKNITSLINKMN